MIRILSLRATNFLASRIRKMASFVTIKSRICWRKKEFNLKSLRTTKRFTMSIWIEIIYLVYNGTLDKHIQQCTKNVEDITVFIAPSVQNLGNSLEMMNLNIWNKWNIRTDVELKNFLLTFAVHQNHLLGIHFLVLVCTEPNLVELYNTN